jgi:hypothetical protein
MGRATRLWYYPTPRRAKAMARLLHSDPYRAAIDDILALAKRQSGWNSYDADPAVTAGLLGAVGLVVSFNDLDTNVPRPAVGMSPDGAVILRWLVPDREVEIAYRGIDTGDYSVLRRDTGDVVAEGSLRELDPLKDIVATYVIGQRQGSWH